ncbi:MAG: 2-(1,2-epoxy-1,2-dihydrophenyl)acetyl-CoA isomerase [Calditrichaeota bacterium]|nr:2-(1,2-epoxy-1,2-dihydrophenyl)acetyl-CoA isomerase [Calditrichota bacterium]
MSETIRVMRKDEICWLTLNRPEVKNAVDAQTMIRLREEIEASEKDGSRVIVISGSEGAFSSGADIKAAFAANVSPEDAYRIMMDAYSPALLAIKNSPLPVLAAIDGIAAGIGLNLALMCDLRVASERAQFSEIFIHVGLIPDGGGTYTLPRIVGLGRAMELAMLGETLNAARALEMGLINRIYPNAQFQESVEELARQLTRQAPLALARMKRAFWSGWEGSFEDALVREAELQREIFLSEDGFEGFRAFLEKRPPKWKTR